MLTERKWKLEAVPYLVMGVFFCLCLGSLVANLAGFSAETARTSSLRFALFVLMGLLFQGTTLVLIAVFLRHSETTWTDAFGFRNATVRRCLGLAAGALAVFLPIAWTLNYLTGLLIQRAGEKPVLQQAVQMIQEHPPLAQTIYMGISTMLLAPLVEELFFRGIIYAALKQMGYPRFALYGTALLFGAIHSNLLTFCPLFLLALVLAWLYETTNNLLAPIALHALFNAVNFIILLGEGHWQKWFNQLTHLFK